MARNDQAPSMEVFESYFQRADLDRDGRISGAEAVAFFQGSNLPKHVLAQIWMHADQNRTGFLGRTEFFNALRLVTVAQSGRELSPDIVKAALFGPAAAKIPAPRINSVATPAPQVNSVAQPGPQMGPVAPTASQNQFRGPQIPPNMGLNQQFYPSQFRPPQATPRASSLPVQGASQGFPGAGNVVGPRPPGAVTSSVSTDWPGARPGGMSIAPTSHTPNRVTTSSMIQDGFGLAPSGPTASLPPRPQPSGMASVVSSKPQDLALSSLQTTAKESKGLPISGNGFSSDSVFGGDIFAATPPAKQDAPTSTFSASNMSNSSATVAISTGPQSAAKQAQQVDPLSSLAMPGGINIQRISTVAKQNQVDAIQSTSGLAGSGVSAGTFGTASNQSQPTWPRITAPAAQKYTKVFVEVDTDRDGKITGEQARNLFLSWRLPREVLKQVWDLSDQDNDSMLSLKEFCTALYLMERYREGRPLPAVLPSGIGLEELFPTAGSPTTAYRGAAWQPSPGLPQQQGLPGTQSVMPPVGLRPPAQAPVPIPSQADGTAPAMQQKSRVPVLEKHLVNQLDKDEQNALTLKFQEATEAENKVQELEKEILDSKEKIEFYRTKMQELILYKSRCDNRLNEITERASADRREVESLTKKYEEKYKQVGDVASKLTIEEATFRDIQERKMELYNAIVKMEQGGSADGILQVRADRIQSDLEELVKALNERCKKYGLRVKPTALVELPFGWQPGIQEGAADWDEDWDKFEDEGFMAVKELTVDVENIVAPPKTKTVWIENVSTDEASPVSNASPSNADRKLEKSSNTSERVTQNESAYAPSEDDLGRSPPGSSPGKSALESPSQEFSGSPFVNHSGADASPHGKESHSDHGGAESSIFGDKFADETSWGPTFDANDDSDSIWGFNTKESDNEPRQRSFFDSGDLGLNPIRTNSPNADSLFSKKEKSPFFADSVPGTPFFNSSSPPRYSQGSEGHSFDNFSRFDSFSMHDSGLFAPRETLARFDSIRSTTDRSQGFPSFDESDPFGTGPFRSSENQTPRRGSDGWSAF